jgi:hypothetical protein
LELEQRDAVISACGQYRYTLERRWGTGAIAVFVLCNPSTADALEDDQTVRKCRGFARRWGCGGFVILNPCALRSRHPSRLLGAVDPVGIQNEAHAHRVLASTTGPLVVGWGDALPLELEAHADRLLAIGRSHGRAPLCLGRCDSGRPRHPLTLAYATPLEPFASSSSSSSAPSRRRGQHYGGAGRG